MEHLKKKFVSARKVNNEVSEQIENVTVDEDAMVKLTQSGLNGYYAAVMTDNNQLIQAFNYTDRKNGKIFFIPEPNPIVIYFETGRHFLNDIDNKRSLLFNELNKKSPEAGLILNYTFAYFQVTSITITFFFNAVEAFINNLIPKDYNYKRELNSKTELFDKLQIQRFLTFDEKIKKVIPNVTGKSFHSIFGQKWDRIKKLKEFRDEIMHTKAYDKESPVLYENLYNTSLNFAYEETQEAVKDFINFYEENLIEECKCGKSE
jgi:hypothetical protein